MPPPSQPVMASHTQNGSLEPQRPQDLQYGLVLPGVDMTALKCVSPEQIMAIARLFQTAAIPFPSQKSTSTNPSPSVASTVPDRSKLPFTVSREGEDAGAEEEDGEIPQITKQREFLRPPPTGPRKRSKSPRSRNTRKDGAWPLPSQHRHRAVNPLLEDSNGFAGAVPSLSSQSAQQSDMQRKVDHAHTDSDRLRKIEASKVFIQELHKAGFTFDQLAKEVRSQDLLQDVYTRLGIPSATSAVRSIVDASQSPIESARDGSCKPSRTKKAIPLKTTLPQDRSAYLAKLQAAKSKKSEKPEVTKSLASKHNTVPENPDSNANPASVTVGARVMSSSLPPSTNKIAKNELIRARLEALKAKQATKSTVPLPAPKESALSNDVPSSLELPGSETRTASTMAHATDTAISEVPASSNPVVASLSPIQAVGPIQSGTSLPLPTTLTPHFTGLPGLFMTAITHTEPQSSATTQSSALRSIRLSQDQSTQEPQQTTASRAPAIAPTHYDNAVKSTSFTQEDTSRPWSFGHRQHGVDEPIIITNSDDEGENDTDDMYGTGTTSLAQGRTLTPRSGGHTPLSSSLPVTPSGVNTTSDLKRKLQEIEEAKRALAEAQKRKKINGTDTKTIPTLQTFHSLAPSNEISDPSSSDSFMGEATERQIVELAINTTGLSPAFSPGAKTNAIAKEKERLKRRLEELQKSRLISQSSLNDTGTAGTDRASLVREQTDNPSRKLSQQLEPIDNVRNKGDLQVETVGDLDCLHIDAGITNLTKTAKDAPVALAALSSIKTDESEKPAMGIDGNDLDLSDADDGLDSLYDKPSPADGAHSHSVKDDSSRHTSIQDDTSEGDSEDDMAMDVSDSSFDSSELDIISATSPGRLPTQQNISLPDANPLTGTVPRQDAVSEDEEYDATKDDLQPSVSNTANNSLIPEAETTPHFKPYESPLVRFKDFRYHPQFTRSVPGGYKSLTYSHNIDVENTLCPYEAAGGICNDKNCMHQHFKTMLVSDNDLLRMMGTENMPVKSLDEEKVWKDGLGAVIKQLRSTNVGKDVSAIAERIAEYRREFMGDPSKVLHLG